MNPNGIVILLCRNGLELTRKCFSSLLALDGKPDILIVDNASTDGTAAWAGSQFHLHERVRRLVYSEQQSVSKCWNDALSYAWTEGHQDALVVNNDTELLPETYAKLSAWNRDYGMVTCVSRRSKEELVYDDILSRPNPDFSCFLLRKWAWNKVGPFDEEFLGAYLEDNDYHVRMHRAGVPAVCLSVPFLHHGSGTVKNATHDERRLIQKNFDLNKKRFFKKYGCYPGTKKYDELFTSEAHHSDSSPEEEAKIQSLLPQPQDESQTLLPVESPS